MWKPGLTQVHMQDSRDCVAYFDTQFECSLTSFIYVNVTVYFPGCSLTKYMERLEEIKKSE